MHFFHQYEWIAVPEVVLLVILPKAFRLRVISPKVRLDLSTL